MTLYLNVNPKIPPLQKQLDKTKVNIRYMLIPPYAVAHIFFDPRRGEVIYELEEPVLNKEEQEILNRIKKAVEEMISVNLSHEQKDQNILEYLDKVLKVIISETGIKVNSQQYEKIFYYVYRDFSGLNEIEALMKDYFIEDIECNGVNEPIYIVHRIFRNLRTNIRFSSIEGLASFVEKIAQKSGRYISYASPLLDGSLPDGSRINATYTKDVTSKGPTFTIRKFTKTPWTPSQLISLETISPEMLAYFWILMEYGLNVMIAGATASGKTTLLNAIAFFIPPEARVVSIEDTRELNLPRENWLPAVARSGMLISGVGEVDMFSLLKNSFRQNPDYVIVGEVRGQEAFVLFQGMASGHSSISTMHADSVETVIRRLETPPINLNPSLLNSLDVVAVMSHVIIGGQETRKLREVIEIINVQSDGVATTNTPFVWNPAQNKFYFKTDIKAFEKIEKRHGVSKETLIRDFELRTRLLYELCRRRIFGQTDTQRVINDYFKNPEAILANYGII